MRKNKKRNRIFLLIILLLGITIGFAALATTLKIDGSAVITKNIWSVYWEPTSVAVTQGSKGSTTPQVVNGTDGSTNTKVTWSVNFELPGDFYEFTVDAANAGTLDAMITQITPTIPQDLPDYVSYSVTYADGLAPALNHLLPKGTKSGNTITPTTEKYKVRIEFLDTITPTQMNAIPEDGLDFDFGYEVKYGQATDDAIDTYAWVLPTGKNKNNLELGDEICIRSQCFNFIKYDGDDAVMLAKYNLNVGSNARVAETFLQEEAVKGNKAGMTRYGTVAFSATNYWNNNGSPSSSYPGTYYPGPNYPTVYDVENYITAPDFTTTCNNTDNCYKTPGYSVAYYVEQYKTKLTNDYNIQIKNARLLTYSEVTDSSIGCDTSQSTFTCPTTGPSAFITDTSFWIGSCSTYWGVWSVSSDGYLMIANFAYDKYNGVRPVIVVEKSNL